MFLSQPLRHDMKTRKGLASGNGFVAMAALLSRILLAGLCAGLSGCVAPIGADKTAPALSYRQIHDNPVSRGQPSRETQFALHRFQQAEHFEKSPDDALKHIQQKAVETKDRGLLFVLSELNYLAAERVRNSLRPWEPRDARDYYLASAVFAWMFLCGEGADGAPDAFDQRFRTACDLYNYGLGWALTARHGTNAMAVLDGGVRRLPFGQMQIKLEQPGFHWPLSSFNQFVLVLGF